MDQELQIEDLYFYDVVRSPQNVLSYVWIVNFLIGPSHLIVYPYESLEDILVGE
jgi:hypothetical protein